MSKSKKRSIIAITSLAVLLVLSSLALVGCSSDSSNNNNTNNNNATETNNSTENTTTSTSTNVITEADASSEYSTGIHHAVLTVEGYEPITIELNADSAPLTVWNFATLVNNGYYNGLTFYRFQEGFCMQGGTLGNTASGSDSSLSAIAGEFSSNGYETNTLSDDFKRGTVAMARTSLPDSATSTFFVTLDTSRTVSSALNGEYAAFGTIDEEGMAIIDQIVNDHLEAASADASGMGIVEDEANQATITSIVMVD